MAVLKWLLKRQVCVKPVMGGWTAMETTILGSFIDDLMSFSPFVAFYNLAWLWKRRNA